MQDPTLDEPRATDPDTRAAIAATLALVPDALPLRSVPRPAKGGGVRRWVELQKQREAARPKVASIITHPGLTYTAEEEGYHLCPTDALPALEKRLQKDGLTPLPASRLEARRVLARHGLQPLPPTPEGGDCA